MYLLSFVKKFSYSAREQLLNPKKIYCIDSGLRKAVSFVFSEDWGKLTENLVFNELKKQELEVYYWKGRGEVDFIVKEGKKVTQLIQVCYELSDPFTKEREIKSLVEASAELRCKNALVITSDNEGEEKHKGLVVKFVPLWRWLLSPAG
ncbi:ATP-binding protein [Candidatus Woesearchaeota archaeon]|nr:ATP-binding protein [Candidatus Woesearchaeota archaeon]